MKKTARVSGQNHKNSNNILADFAQQLIPLENNFAFLPCNDQKYPLVKNWQNKSFSIDEILAFDDAQAIGVRTGIGRLLSIDLDGESSFYFLYDRNLIPQYCKTWQIHRSNNDWKMKLLLQITEDQYNELPVKDFISKRATGTKEQLEVFFSKGRQVIIAGRHPSRGKYFWPRGFEPDALSAPDPDWWQFILEASQVSHSVTASTTNCRDWERLLNCPICGRNTRNICSIHKDKNTIRCYQGGEFCPPNGLKAGEIIKDGQWAFSRESISSLGTFSIFVRHKPTPIAKLWSKLND